MTRTSDARGNRIMQPRPGAFTAQDLQEANIAAADMKAAGFTFQQLRDAGYVIQELIAADANAGQLRVCDTLSPTSDIGSQFKT